MSDDFIKTSDTDAAARACVVAAERLHAAITAGSPERGQALLTTLRLAGAQPVVTVLCGVDPGVYEVKAGMVDRETGKNLSTFEQTLMRTDLPSGGDLLAGTLGR